MAKLETDRSKWTVVKKSLSNWETKELLSLIGELYRLSTTNRDLLHSRSRVGGDPIDRYRRMIEKGLRPNVLRDERTDCKLAKRAVKDYCSTVGDPAGSVELMIYFVECGNTHVTQYGDFDSSLMSAILKTFADACGFVHTLPKEQQEPFKIRLQAEVERAESMGYGYYDEMADTYDGAFG